MTAPETNHVAGMNERPVLNEVRHAADDGQIAALIAYSPDRLSRDPIHVVSLMREFKAAGVKGRFVSGASDGSSGG